ncbi:hypothetical protein ACLB2K_040243 [Fragaria x ananassa]
MPERLVQLVADCSCKLSERYSDTPGSKEVTEKDKEKEKEREISFVILHCPLCSGQGFSLDRNLGTLLQFSSAPVGLN